MKAQYKNHSTTIFDKVSFSQSYISLLLGIVVVVIAVVAIVVFVKNRNFQAINPLKPEIISKEMEKVKKESENVYTVAPGDTLWSIAEKKYNSGYEWVEIAKVNSLSSPDVIEVGAKLNLPKDDSRILAASTAASPSAITGDSYTVVKDDTLWDIAIRAYGDGYKWPDIAKANNLANPDLIYEGNVFKLPR